MPHLNGIETARRLREALPQTKIVLLTMHTEDPYVLEAMQAGAVGYVLNPGDAGLSSCHSGRLPGRGLFESPDLPGGRDGLSKPLRPPA
jgi:PleD family two-component response regulator